MGAVLFFFGFLAAGIFGSKIFASFEIAPAERIGAEAFLFVLCIGASATSILSYVQGSRRFHRYPGGIAGLAGGVAVAGIFCAAVSTIYLGLGFAVSVSLALVLPGLAAFVWPLLSGNQLR